MVGRALASTIWMYKDADPTHSVNVVAVVCGFECVQEKLLSRLTMYKRTCLGTDLVWLCGWLNHHN